MIDAEGHPEFREERRSGFDRRVCCERRGGTGRRTVVRRQRVLPTDGEQRESDRRAGDTRRISSDRRVIIDRRQHAVASA